MHRYAHGTHKVTHILTPSLLNIQWRKCLNNCVANIRPICIVVETPESGMMVVELNGITLKWTNRTEAE